MLSRANTSQPFDSDTTVGLACLGEVEKRATHKLWSESRSLQRCWASRAARAMYQRQNQSYHSGAPYALLQ